MGYGADIKQQFDIGRSKGEADRQKIKLFLLKIWRAILKDDAIPVAFQFALLSAVVFFFSLVFLIAKALNDGVLTISPDVSLSDESAMQFSNLMRVVKIVSFFTISMFVLGIYQAYNRLCIKRIIKQNKIAVIK